MNRLVSTTLMGIVATAAVWSQQENSDLRSGNKRYKAEKYTEAEVEYRKALEKNNKSFETNFNLGNALFRQEKYADALQYYDISNALSQGEKQKIAAGYHNSGNALLMDNKIQESIEAYKNALRNNPKDDETRYNLAYAQSMLKKQEQNQNKDQEQNKENKSEEKEENQEQQQEQQQNRQKQQEQPRMSKENAQQILEALMQDEKDAKDKAKKEIPAGSRRVEKDW